MTNKINLAVVGCGEWGKNLIRNFFELGVLFSVCDENDKIAKKYSQKYNIKNLSFIETINHPDISGVVLAVPAQLHSPMAIKAINKGKHVFIEKPLSTNMEEAIMINNALKKNNTKLMVGHLLQFHPIFKKILRIVRAGEIGKLLYIKSSRLSLGKVRSKEDIVWSFAPHDVSMILSLVGEDPDIVSTNSISILKKGIADIANIHMQFKSGLKSDVSVSWFNANKEVKLEVYGSNGILIFDDTKTWNEKLAIHPYKVMYKNKEIEIEKSYLKYFQIPEEEPLKIECQHFINIQKYDIEPLTDIKEGMRVVSVLSAASKSYKDLT